VRVPRPDWGAAGRILATLALGLVGGAVFAWWHLPLPWMLGAMSLTMAASVAGVGLLMPNVFRSIMLTVLGVLLGSGFTADVAAGVVAWLPSIAAIPIYILVSLAAGLLLLRRLGRLESVTAFFSAAPGGLSEMMLLGERAGGDMRQIALLHGTRIFIVVFTVPFLVRQIGGTGQSAATLAAPGLAGPVDLLILAGCAVIGYLGGRLVRLPAAVMLGPLLASAAAHITGLVTTAPPPPVVIAAQVVVGAAMGARFAGIPPRVIGQLLLVGGALCLLLLSISLLTAGSLDAVTGIGFVALLLAFAPGGMAEMCLVALALGAEPIFVATHHVIRIGLVVLLAPLLFRLWRRWKPA
jgi:membrane AbrB-like protein